MPLPLGVNVIRRALGAELVARVSRVLRDGDPLGARAPARGDRRAGREDRGDAALARTALLDRYLGMYANQDTEAMAPDVRRAIDVLFERARAAGLLPDTIAIEWAP